MAEEIGFENGRNSNFQVLVTLTLDPAIWHTVVHHSSTSTCIPNFIEIEETFLWTDGRTDVRTDGHFPPLILLGRLLEVDLKRTRCIFRTIFSVFHCSMKLAVHGFTLDLLCTGMNESVSISTNFFSSSLLPAIT